MARITTKDTIEEKVLSFFEDKLDPQEWIYRSKVYQYTCLLQKEYGGDRIVLLFLAYISTIDERFLGIYSKSRDSYEITDIFNEIDLQPTQKMTISETLSPFLITPHAQDTIETKMVNDAIILTSFSYMGFINYMSLLDNPLTMTTTVGNKIDCEFKERITLLNFPISIANAKKEIKFIYFIASLISQPTTIQKTYPGKYIILEGNSCTGKTTQGNCLAERMNSLDNPVKIFEEPTKFYKEYETFYNKTANAELTYSKPLFRLYSIIGDRYQQIHDHVLPELIKGNTIISVRSFISMLVYQCDSDYERRFINYLHSFLPEPVVVIIFDTTEEICLERAKNRNTRITPFDKISSLKKTRPRYLNIANATYFDFPIEVIDSSDPIEMVTEKTIKIISKYL